MSKPATPPIDLFENQTLPPTPAGRPPRSLLEQLGDVGGLPSRMGRPRGPNR